MEMHAAFLKKRKAPKVAPFEVQNPLRAKRNPNSSLQDPHPRPWGGCGVYAVFL